MTITFTLLQSSSYCWTTLWLETAIPAPFLQHFSNTCPACSLVYTFSLYFAELAQQWDLPLHGVYWQVLYDTPRHRWDFCCVTSILISDIWYLDHPKTNLGIRCSWRFLGYPKAGLIQSNYLSCPTYGSLVPNSETSPSSHLTKRFIITVPLHEIGIQCSVFKTGYFGLGPWA